ncbi:MAG: type II toxin-antitoxin system PemK/MazF family toxin [Solirubrobacteraceae bacterium]
MTDPTPKRGEVWIVRFGAGGVGEPTKNRPAVVLSDEALVTGSPTDLFVVIPFSASLTASTLRPTITASHDAAIEHDSIAVVAAIRGVPRDRLLNRVGLLSTDALERVLTALRATLAI